MSAPKLVFVNFDLSPTATLWLQKLQAFIDHYKNSPIGARTLPCTVARSMASHRVSWTT